MIFQSIFEKFNLNINDKEMAILTSILTNEPVTAYKIAVENRMHFSYVYKKVESFEKAELVGYYCEPYDGRKLYYLLPKGVILLLGHERPERLYIDKLRDKWHLKDWGDQEIIDLVNIIIRHYRPGMPINDIVMVAYALYTRYLAGDIAVGDRERGVLNKLFRRSFEALVSLISYDCLEKCKGMLASREYI